MADQAEKAPDGMAIEKPANPGSVAPAPHHVPTVRPLAAVAPAGKPSAPVIPLPLKKAVETFQSSAAAKLRPQALRRRLLAISFFLMVILPSILGSIYFIFIASDRYTASAGFSVRSMDATAIGGDLLGSLTGLSSSGSTTTDSYIILNFLKSRELIEKLQAEMDLQRVFGNENVDFLYRLEQGLPIEDLVDYWDWMISPAYDNASSIITFRVQAFNAEDAHQLASLIVKYCQELINKLSQQARRDAVSFSEKEVSSAELRLKLIRNELRDFRANTSSLDPAATATAQIELTTGLERQLIELRARLATLLVTLSEASPSVQQLRKEITSVQTELDLKRAEIGGKGKNLNGSPSNLSLLLANYERLQVEQEFAQQAYTVTLASLERARAEADRQQRFLAVFSPPGMPEDAIYPERYLNSFLVLLVTLLFWGLGTLMVYSVRDHLR